MCTYFQENEKKKQIDRKRRKHEDLRRKMARLRSDSLEDYISADKLDETDSVTTGRSEKHETTKPVSNVVAPVSDIEEDVCDAASMDVSVNMNSSHPEKEKLNKLLYDIVPDKSVKLETLDHNNLIDAENVVENVLQESHLLDEKNEPDPS